MALKLQLLRSTWWSTRVGAQRKHSACSIVNVRGLTSVPVQPPRPAGVTEPLHSEASDCIREWKFECVNMKNHFSFFHFESICAVGDDWLCSDAQTDRIKTDLLGCSQISFCIFLICREQKHPGTLSSSAGTDRRSSYQLSLISTYSESD